MGNVIERAVRAALPDRTIDAIDARNTRPGNETAFVSFVDADPVYVKTATDTTRRLVRETAAVRYAAAHCSVAAPAVVAADPAGDPAYLVTEPLPGTVFNERWTGGADREQLVRRLGTVVAGVQEARFDRPGVITGVDADGLELRATTWTETLCETIEWRASDWFPDRFADLPGRLVETVRDRDPTLENTTPTLLHGDPSRINLHLDPDGLLDWERALVGDPAFGVVEAAFHHVGQPDVDDADEPPLREALYEGYRERAGDLPPGLEQNRPLYEAVSYLLVPQAFEDWAPRVDTPNDELAADVREEFDARLDRAREAMP
ncbi:hypothetical protein BRC81_02240 [Halobacteriales archaeon QS_1_68_20]|nr:MAG: hypothetical protein BRC81_02240 [Halobacteriales archaeon QS_1_68_20]